MLHSCTVVSCSEYIAYVMDCTLRFACYMLDVIYDMSHVIWYLLYVIWYMEVGRRLSGKKTKKMLYGTWFICYVISGMRFLCEAQRIAYGHFASQLARLLVASAAAPKRRRGDAHCWPCNILCVILPLCGGGAGTHCPKLVQKLMGM